MGKVGNDDMAVINTTHYTSLGHSVEHGKRKVQGEDLKKTGSVVEATELM